MDHPIVAQTIEDCLTEAMDVDGFLEVLRGLRTVRSSGAPWTRPSRRLSRAGSSRPSPTRSSTTPRSRSAARRRCSPAASSTASPPTRSARSTPRRSRGSGKRRGPSPPTPRKSTRRSCGWDTSRRRKRAPWQEWIEELSAARPRRAEEGPLVRGRGDARSEGGSARGAWKRSARSLGEATIRCSSSSRARASSCAPASTAGRPGATGGCSRASSATRSTGCGGRSSR